jgi:hypothetical protein
MRRVPMSAEAEIAETPLVALDAAIRRADAPSRMQADLEGWLREHGVVGEDLRALVAVGAARLLVYRALVHNRMRNAVRAFVPRTAARLGAERLRADFERWLDACAARSYYLRDVPEEFVAWAIPQWERDPEIPTYIPDLARHELLDNTVKNDPAGGEPPTGRPVALDRPLAFDGSARSMSYAHAVHRLPADTSDRTEPERVPTSLLVYRDAEHKVRYLQLTPWAAAVLARLLAGEPVAPALNGAAEDLGEPLDDDKLASAATLLADLGERGVMLGAG